MQKWSQYLLGREFVIRSDQKILKELLQQIVQTPDQQLYVRKLMGYKFTIEYKKGRTNRVADALSCREETSQVAHLDSAGSSEDVDAGHICAVLTAAAQPVPQLLDLLRRETASSLELKELVSDIKEGRAAPHLTLAGGLVYFKRRVYMGSRSSARVPIMTELHNSPTAGHPGFDRTLRHVTAGFLLA